jgi:PPE-repeat protein
MFSIPAISTMLWDAMPPEINTSRLMAGAGPAPMLQAAAGWEAFAILLETQADELAGSLSSLGSVWTGAAGEQAISSTMPMVIWLRTLSFQCMERALKAAGQAEAYSTALATTPQLPEIEQNHITNATLNATNFLGINTVPIGLNEADYARMWMTAAAVMTAYGAATFLGTTFTPIVPHKPIVMPGPAEAAAATAIAAAAPGAAESMVRNATMAKVAGEGMFQIGVLQGGRAGSSANMMSTHGQTMAGRAEDANQQPQQQNQAQKAPQQGLQMVTQMASQLGSTAAQLPQQGMQMVTQPIQQLSQPLQQMTSLFSSSGADRAQLGMIGASPFSNHPLVGGSGPGSGAGLVRAASLPGAGGTMARTPMMQNLIGKIETPITAGAGAGGPGTGLAPVGAGQGGGGPMGMHGEKKKSGGTRDGLATPSLLAYDTREEEDDDW